MSMRKNFVAVAIGGVLAVLLSGFATAGESEEVSLGEDWVSVSETDLADRRGGQELELELANLADLDSRVESNEVGDGVITGMISVSDNAFSGLSGIHANSFNTGNNCSIQTNMIVNLYMQ